MEVQLAVADVVRHERGIQRAGQEVIENLVGSLSGQFQLEILAGAREMGTEGLQRAESDRERRAHLEALAHGAIRGARGGPNGFEFSLDLLAKIQASEPRLRQREISFRAVNEIGSKHLLELLKSERERGLRRAGGARGFRKPSVSRDGEEVL